MKVAVIGAGLAGWAVVDALCELSKTLGIKLLSTPPKAGDEHWTKNDWLCIHLITTDQGDRYHKPMLSSAFSQHKSAKDLIRTDGQTSANALNITLSHHCALIDFDKTSGSLQYQCLQTKALFTCDDVTKVVFAVGASPDFPVGLDNHQRLFHINHLNQFTHLQTQLNTTPTAHIAIIGAGMVGIEICEDLKKAYPNSTITLIDRGDYPLSSLVPKAVGLKMVEILTASGIEYINQVCVSQSDENKIYLSNGTIKSCDVVILATGLCVNENLFNAFGVACDRRRGVTVKESTLQPDSTIPNWQGNLYAIGDCINIDGQPCRFVAPLKAQAKAIAHHILGQTGGDYVHKAPMIRLKNKWFSLIIQGKLGNVDDWQLKTQNDTEYTFVQPTGATLQIKW